MMQNLIQNRMQEVVSRTKLTVTTGRVMHNTKLTDSLRLAVANILSGQRTSGKKDMYIGFFFSHRPIKSRENKLVYHL